MLSICALLALFYLIDVFSNIYFPVWTKLIVFLSILTYVCWMFVIIKERAEQTQ